MPQFQSIYWSTLYFIYGDLLTLKTHHYKLNSMNSLNSMKELWKNWNVFVCDTFDLFTTCRIKSIQKFMTKITNRIPIEKRHLEFLHHFNFNTNLSANI